MDARTGDAVVMRTCETLNGVSAEVRMMRSAWPELNGGGAVLRMQTNSMEGERGRVRLNGEDVMSFSANLFLCEDVAALLLRDIVFYLPWGN